MQLIKVSAIDSTNSYGREMFKNNPKMAPACILANKQLQGRGQRGTQWDSEPGKNLTLSLVWPYLGIAPQAQFLLSATVATALVKGLEKLEIPQLKVKWPNDIMSANYKIGGILIENIIMEGVLAASVIGIGLNINQERFSNLTQASSLKLVSGHHFVLAEVFEKIMANLETDIKKLPTLPKKTIINNYNQRLFKKDKLSTFQYPDKSFFTGVIKGVSEEGRLLVEKENALENYDLKEVKLIF